MENDKKFEIDPPNNPSRCTWTKDADPETNPHFQIPLTPREDIMPNILHAVGNTPMVKLNRIPQAEGLKCEVVVKCEFFNPGGSVKDRIGYRMVLDAEKDGLLVPGVTTIIEPTSGNTGIGLALACSVRNYRCIIVMPEKMSDEKVTVLRSLGAEIIRTPTLAGFDSPDGIIAVSQKLQKQIPNSIILNQYKNPGNPTAHYDLTAMEIYTQCEGKIDTIVVGAGTGGTISGIGRRLKELCPKCVVVGVDPEGSILAKPPIINEKCLDIPFYEVEGIGYDFIPTVLDRSVIDLWVKVDDKLSFTMARRLIRDEALLCGGSSGAAVAAAIMVAKNLRPDQRCVVLLPDGIRNYMTKFAQDAWMQARNFMPCENIHNHWWWELPVSSLKLAQPLVIHASQTCVRALHLMKKHSFDQLPVVGNSGEVIGVATATHILSMIVNKKVKENDPVEKAILRHFAKVSLESIVGLVFSILEKSSFVLVIEKNSETKRDQVVGLITIVDLMQYITRNTECDNNVVPVGGMKKVQKKLSNMHMSQASESNGDTKCMAERKTTDNNSSMAV